MESDWKFFRKHLLEWRERYLRKVNPQIVAILTDENRTPTSQFWDAKERMDEQAQILHACLDGYSRSELEMFVLKMYRHGMVDDDDLAQFSDEFRAGLAYWLERPKS